jgi:cytidine deaminase
VNLTPHQKRHLVAAAAGARRRAYAPYSRFRVGAALLAADGTVFTGGNVENASAGLTICAERVAVGNAVNAGAKRFVAVAIVTPGAATPCGACRQVLAEFGDCLVICADAHQRRRLREWRLAELLPEAFARPSLPISPSAQNGHKLYRCGSPDPLGAIPPARSRRGRRSHKNR